MGSWMHREDRRKDEERPVRAKSAEGYITGSCKKAGTSANHVICPRMSPLVEKNIVFGNFLSEYELLDLCGAIKKYCCDMCIKCIKNYRNSSALELAVAIATQSVPSSSSTVVGCKIHCSRSTQGKNMI